MARHNRDGGQGAARSGAPDSVPNRAATRKADQHDAAVLARMGKDHYTRVPLRGEFRPVDGVRIVLVTRGPLGGFNRLGYDVDELPSEALAEALAWARQHVATFDATFAPNATRVSA